MMRGVVAVCGAAVLALYACGTDDDPPASQPTADAGADAVSEGGSACPDPGISKGPWTLGLAEDGVRLRWEACRPGAPTSVELTPEGGGQSTTAEATVESFIIVNTYVAPFNPNARDDEAGTYYNHEVVFTGLTPGACYRYRIGESDAFDGRFCTARPSGESFRFLAMADTNPGLGDATKKLLALAVKDGFDFAIHAGDIQYYDSGFDTWNYWFEAFEPMLRHAPLLPSVGNHEQEKDDEYDQYHLRFFGKAGFGGTDAYYHFQSGGVWFFTLSTEEPLDAASAQLGWFKGELEKAKAQPGYRFSVVFFHKPFLTCGHKSENGAARQLFEPIFEEHGVVLVVQGHMHAYERFEVPLSNPSKTLTYLTVGGGGGLLGDVDENIARVTCTMRKSSGKFHQMALFDVTPAGISARVFDPDDQTRDEFSIAVP